MHNVWMIETLQDLHLTPHALLVPFLTFFDLTFFEITFGVPSVPSVTSHDLPWWAEGSRNLSGNTLQRNVNETCSISIYCCWDL